MTTDTRPIEDRYLRGEASLDKCLEATMRWYGGCASGKANAVVAIYGEYNARHSYVTGLYAMLAWIERMYPHATEKWAELAGFQKVEPEPEEVIFKFGDICTRPDWHRPVFVLSTSECKDGNGALGIQVRDYTGDWAAYIDCTIEGQITGDFIRWNYLASFKRDYTKVKGVGVR